MDMARNALKNAEEIEQSLKEIREYIKKECKNDEKEVVPPFTIADLTIKVSCRNKEVIEDVIFYLRAYLRREYGQDDITECLDREIANARQQYLKAAASKEETKGSSYE